MAKTKAKATAKAAAKKKLRAATKAGDFNALAKIATKPGRNPGAVPALPAPAEAAMVRHDSLSPSPLNPRSRASIEGLAALSQSIVAEGLLQSLLVRPSTISGHGALDTFEIICGERRWRAIGMAITEGRLSPDYAIPVRIRSVTDAELVELAATENMGREDMHPLDEAEAIAAMQKYYPDNAEVARRLGIPERTLYRRSALLRLVDELRQDLRGDKITLQQAAALSLGAPAAQREHRGLMAREAPGINYYKDASTIRRAMIEKRVPVTRAAFPLEQYTGEYLDDPETGDRYFVDLAEFKNLQAAAIEAKIKELKAGKWAFVKKVDTWQQSGYGKAKKGDKGAGAIYWLEHDGAFHTRENVLDPVATIAKRRGEPSETPAAAPKRDWAAEEEAEQRPLTEACKALLDSGRRIIALLTLDALERAPENLDVENCETAAERERIEAITARVLDFLGEGSTLEAIFDINDDTRVKLFRALEALEDEKLLRLFVALKVEDAARDLFDYHHGLTPLGMLVLQRELPLEAGKEAAE